MNLQNFNGGGFHVTQILQRSRNQFLDATDMEILMNNSDLFPNSNHPVPALRRGLYRRDCDEYIDTNEWIVVGPGNQVTRSRTLTRQGEVIFNYTVAHLFLNNNRTLIRRTIRRRDVYQLRTLVHYLVVPGHIHI